MTIRFMNVNTTLSTFQHWIKIEMKTMQNPKNVLWKNRLLFTLPEVEIKINI